MSSGKSTTGLTTPKFLALDTETYKGKAFLLSSAERVWPISCFEDFIEVTKSLGRKFVFFNLDYDVSAICKHLPHDVSAKLYLDRAILYNGVWLRYVPSKFFSFVSDRHKYEFFDLYPFFQCSLNTASSKYLDIVKLELPKDLIGSLSPAVYQKNKELVDSYAIRDSQLLQSLTDKFTASLNSTGLKTSALYSPGYLAKKYITQRKITIPPIPRDYRYIIESTYHGGRIEIAKRGFLPECTIYDLKSAYPWAMRDLPDLEDADYSLSESIESPYYLALCDLEVNEKHVAPLETTRKGINVFPNGQYVRKWITCYEHQAIQSPPIHRSLNIFPRTENKPYQDLIDTLFAMRKQSGMEGLIYKLILNSLYGITAERKRCYWTTPLFDVVKRLRYEKSREQFQSIVKMFAHECPKAEHYWDKLCDCEWCHALRYNAKRRLAAPLQSLVEYDDAFWTIGFKDGRFKNLLIASLITARVRARLWESIRETDGSYIASFTDSLITTKPLTLPLSDTLGAWEQKYSGPLTILGCGIYETEAETKFRGFKMSRANDSDRPLQAMLQKSKGTKISIMQLDRVSFGQFVRLGWKAYNDFNVLTPYEKVLDINQDRKREWDRPFDSGRDASESLINSIPLSMGRL